MVVQQRTASDFYQVIEIVTSLGREERLCGKLKNCHMATALEATSSVDWQTESYMEQITREWPRRGRHILAQYDDRSVVVYQAFCPEIAEYAVKHQK